MKIPVELQPVPSNASFSPPLLSEAARLPLGVGHFRFVGGGGAAARGGPQLVLPAAVESAAGAELARGAMRALISLSVDVPLRILLAGPAQGVVELMRAMCLPAAPAATLRALRVHRYAALPFGYPADFEAALRASVPAPL